MSSWHYCFPNSDILDLNINFVLGIEEVVSKIYVYYFFFLFFFGSSFLLCGKLFLEYEIGTFGEVLNYISYFLELLKSL